MSTITTHEATVEGLATRILREGYGEGAWHGPDLKAALADVGADLAFTRPAAGRHNIAELALHHAYYARDVRARLGDVAAEPFVLDGDGWFDVPDSSTVSWATVLEVVEREQQRLAACVADIASGRRPSPLGAAERIDLVLGITCHAVYHAGQIELIKRLVGA